MTQVKYIFIRNLKIQKISVSLYLMVVNAKAGKTILTAIDRRKRAPKSADGPRCAHRIISADTSSARVACDHTRRRCAQFQNIYYATVVIVYAS